MRNPSEVVTPYLRLVHRAIVATRLGKVRVDITELRFMNSSSIRSLVDWVGWVSSEPQDKRYTLSFLASADITWQSTTLSAIHSLAPDHVEVTES